MKVSKYETKEDWLDARRGKVTGSRLKDLVVKRGTDEKLAFYEIIAERIAETPDEENPMERGTRLEEEAVALFAEEIEKKIDNSLVMWEHDTYKDIAISPDGIIDEGTAVEVKCLSSASHIRAIVTKKIPDEYEYQVLQYFIVNSKLHTLYFVMYDPRMPKHLQLHHFVVHRNDIQDDVDTYFEYQKEKLTKIEDIINELTF